VAAAVLAERLAAALPPARPPLRDDAWLTFFPRPDPLFLPPPVSLLTVPECQPEAFLRARRRVAVQSGAMRIPHTFLAISVALAPTAARSAACAPDSTIAERVLGGGLCLAAATYGAPRANEAPVLVVVVHGDISDGGRATYHAAFARTLARPGSIVVALIRPGYADADGRASDGATLGRSDNYTAANVAAVAGAIEALKRHYRPRRLVYVGHSGGAAIGGVLIGRRPGLIDAAVLVSCPCDIARWLRERRRPAWTRSLSPDFFIARVPVATEVIALTGRNDDNTFPALAQDYVDQLARRGVNARFVAVDGAGHGLAPMAAATAAVVEELAGR
jgi:pimeloyl-ACP methyl ester carboxylesterase